jgi:uncharacterized short protein YbdD (DUF466 family)
MRNVARRFRVAKFVGAAHKRTVAEILGLLGELSGERAYDRYVAARRMHWFPEEGIMTRREYGRWRAEAQEQNAEMRC